VILKAAVSAGSARFACELFVDFSLVTQIARAVLDPAALASTAKGASSILPLLFAASSALFTRRIGSFHRGFLSAEGGFPFAAFLDLIPARDRAVALQNFALRSLGTHNLRSLFSYSESVPQPDGSTRTRVLTPYAFDEPGLLSLLPETAQEDWRAARSRPPASEADHRRLVSETLEGIRREILKKRLLLSPRALLVLEKFVLPGLRAAAQKNLDAAAAAGVPFSTVRLMPKPQIQQFLGTQPNRSLALCLMGSEKELGFVTANVSAARASSLAEDIAYIRREYGAGRVETADVLGAMRGVEAAARAMIERREKQAERERARARKA